MFLWLEMREFETKEMTPVLRFLHDQHQEAKESHGHSFCALEETKFMLFFFKYKIMWI